MTYNRDYKTLTENINQLKAFAWKVLSC